MPRLPSLAARVPFTVTSALLSSSITPIAVATSDLELAWAVMTISWELLAFAATVRFFFAVTDAFSPIDTEALLSVTATPIAASIRESVAVADFVTVFTTDLTLNTLAEFAFIFADPCSAFTVP